MLQIVFRADASDIIGSGHIMRCLTLASELVKKDCQITFITREHKSHLNELIISKGFKVETLPIPIGEINQSDDKTWLGCSQVEDAQQTIAALKHITTIDILIVDHYAIDRQWQALLRPYCEKILVIDDLANRHHLCDYLLDQTLNRERQDYTSFVPKGCKLLLGQKYMLLRDEFSEKRFNAVQARKDVTYQSLPRKILVTMGGTDPTNLTEQIVKALKLCKVIKPHLSATLVMSSQSMHTEKIRQEIKHEPWINLELNCTQMAELMVTHDIAIGASGSTSWERCCLALPSLNIISAENQQTIANNLEKKGAIINLGWFESLGPDEIAKQLIALIDNINLYQQMVESCLNCCDGLGVQLASQRLLKSSFTGIQD